MEEIENTQPNASETIEERMQRLEEENRRLKACYRERVRSRPSTPFRVARLKLGLNQALAAKLLCTNNSSIFRWEAEQVKPSGWASRIIEMLVELSETMPPHLLAAFGDQLAEALEQQVDYLCMWMLFGAYHDYCGNKPKTEAKTEKETPDATQD